MKVSPLPRFPSFKCRNALPPSQQAALNQNILAALNALLSLPASSHIVTSSLPFITSYAQDYASKILESLIWEHDSPSRTNLKLGNTERAIHKLTLQMAERVAYSLDFQTLMDLSIVYGSSNPKRVRSLFESASSKNPVLSDQVKREVVPTFVEVLRSSQSGLYGLRKLSHIILSALRPAPPSILHIFARDITFVLAIAEAHQHELTTIAQSYGGFRFPPPNNTPDDWQRILLETKATFVDSFHILIRTLFNDVATSQSSTSPTENAFDLIFALLDLSPPSSLDTPPTPFLNQSLLADYQHVYDLSRTVAKVIHRANDARADLLESTLQSLDVSPAENPGALKLLLRSSGAPPGIDNLGRGSQPTQVNTGIKGKGKAKDTTSIPIEDDPALDAAISQVLDIFPDQDPQYLRHLLAHPDYPFKGDAERLIEALLEGTAPSPEDVAAASLEPPSLSSASLAVQPIDDFSYTKDRRNIFDDDQMDLGKVHIGKKTVPSSDFLQDRTFMQDMKSNILQRAEAAAYASEDDGDGGHSGGYQGEPKGRDLAFEEEDVDEGSVIHVRDGEDSEEEDADTSVDGDRDGIATPQDPTTILELAYLRDPKLFDRDVQTKRSKNRADLRAQTGWSDEQIEGWRIMLERNPNKDRILSKHEFSGNQRGLFVQPTPSRSHSNDNRGRGHGRGGGRGSRGSDRGRGRGQDRDQSRGQGRGRGRGRGQGEGGSNEDGSRERAWKDKNKARQANHDRKRGHDKKMSKVGGPS